MVGAVTVEWWTEDESPVWRRENASDVLRVIKWLQAHSVKWYLTSDGQLQVYPRDMESPIGERQETVGEGCSLRFAGGDVEVLEPDPDQVMLAEMVPSKDRDMIRTLLGMKLRVGLFPSNDDLAWVTSAIVAYCEQIREGVA